MKVLHLEDDPNDAFLVRGVLAAEFPGCIFTHVETREHFVASLAPASRPDLILSDFSIPGFDGLAALALARERVPDIPFVFLSGSIGEERAIAAVRAGAYDYVLKDNLARLSVVVHRALEDFARRRLRREDEVRLLELAGIIERAAEAIVVTDMGGRITLWNAGAARLYGIPTAAAMGRLSEEIFSGSELAQVRQARAATLDKGEWQQELKLTTRDGRDIVVDLHMTLVRDAADRPLARLTIGTDVTEKKKLGEQFLRAQRVESLGLLAAGIAHDFNNILAPLDMVASLLRRRVTDPGDVRLLDILEKNAQRGAGLVRQILGFARGIGGDLQLTQVHHLLRDIGDVIQASFPKAIAIDLKESADLWPIQANPTQIHQVLLNLAVNARDAMLPGGGRLLIRADNLVLGEAAALQLEGSRPGEFLVLEVADTGAGMAPEVLARIWEPFFTTKDEGQGTGLGLSTVRGIVAAHGGFITVASQVGQGTVFRVFLPALKPAAPDGVSAPAARAPRGRGELILVVDDEANVREVTTAILTHHGYRVLGCADGVEAVGLYTDRGQEIQLVITDLNMPNLGGDALARVLLRLRPGIKMLSITGLCSPVAQKAAEPGPFAARLQKPFSAEMLLVAVSRLLHCEP